MESRQWLFLEGWCQFISFLKSTLTCLNNWYLCTHICNQQNLKANSFWKSYIILANSFATQDYLSRISLHKQWIQLFAFIYWVFTLSFNEVIETSGDMKRRRADTWISIPALPVMTLVQLISFTPCFFN